MPSIVAFRRLPLLLLPFASWFALTEGKVVGVWTDIEDHGSIVGGYLSNATQIAHSVNLRLAVDAQVGWASESNTVDPRRPVSQQVMDIVDQVTLMDYFTSCSKTSRSSGNYQPFLPAEAVSQHQLVPGDTSDALDEDLVHGRARCDRFR